MIRTLLATTALATLIATGAYAQSATTPAPAEAPATQEAAPVVQRADGSIVTNIIGESVYNGTGDDAQNIGMVSDVVFDEAGQAKSAVIGVGGFLGIGAKDIAFDYGKLQRVERNGDRWLVAQTTKEELTAQPEFDRKPYDPAPAASAAPAAPSASGDSAQGGPPAPVDMNAQPVKRAEGNLATNIIGESVYNGTGDDAQNIGDVNDIVLTKDGKAESLVIGVGGFLGIGEKSVAYPFDKAAWAQKNGDRWLVAQTTKEELTAQPDFNRKAYDPAPATTASNDATTPAPTSPTETAAPAPAEKTAEAPAAATPDAKATDPTQTAAIDKSTLTEVPVGEIRGDDLKGTTVYGANDARVGEIGDVVLAPDSKPDAVIVDVGGFLGMGEKEVAVGVDNLKFMTDKDGKKYLYTTFTKEQLEAQAAYDKNSYAEKRDEQRMMMQ
ncbi:PRC-barrel domain-containing protein [Mesorhizobium helmanticense]|uniref:Photosystem reaction center subunit H n=1 Tax=Mesorhizobium helmanticense TaxID=1776423 RepID=A0A2T4IT97_9HYPH|nr:PRC-barrel domain-containing protein [Mesorhizobium helmanticense]PTE08857.1 photosystem reaction center subunit H [Mesorhizobium helmanticense]